MLPKLDCTGARRPALSHSSGEGSRTSDRCMGSPQGRPLAAGPASLPMRPPPKSAHAHFVSNLLLFGLQERTEGAGWKEFTAPDGRKYYYNKATKESRCEGHILGPSKGSSAGEVYGHTVKGAHPAARLPAVTRPVASRAVRLIFGVLFLSFARWTMPEELKPAGAAAAKPGGVQVRAGAAAVLSRWEPTTRALLHLPFHALTAHHPIPYCSSHDSGGVACRGRLDRTRAARRRHAHARQGRARGRPERPRLALAHGRLLGLRRRQELQLRDQGARPACVAIEPACKRGRPAHPQRRDWPASPSGRLVVHL